MVREGVRPLGALTDSTDQDARHIASKVGPHELKANRKSLRAVGRNASIH